jgi:hypothetical protein
MVELMIWQVVFAIVSVATFLGSVVFVTSFDHFLQSEKMKRQSIIIDALLNKAIAMDNLGISTFSKKISNIQSRVLEIRQNYENDSTSTIFGLNLLEKDLVHLVEIQSIVTRLKECMDLVVVKYSSRSVCCDRIRLAIIEIESLYYRSVNNLPSLVYSSDRHELNFYQVLLDKVESIFLIIERGK